MKFILIILYMIYSFQCKQVNVVSIKLEEKILNSNVLKVKESSVLEMQIGKMSGYGPDCDGCSGYLASGDYVGDGNIYYNDPTYGQVRIVAGDKSYSFGTIVRISNSILGESFLAVVLDRGGSIGLNKKCMFDLLYPSESEASLDGISDEVAFEILRYGY